MKTAILAVTFLASLSAQAKAPGKISCQILIDGKRAVRVAGQKGLVAFAREGATVVVQKVPDKPNRLQFTILGERQTKAAYVVAAFRSDDRLSIQPEINGQQMSVLCLRK